MNYTNTKVTLKNRPVGYPKEEDFEIINENTPETWKNKIF